jgi:rubrerythrin
MNTSKQIEILKTAILLEKRGKTFYEKMAEQTSSSEARKIFTTMAEEETAHIEFLSRQFKNFMKENKFLKNENSGNSHDDDISNQVITGKLKKQISAAGFEAAAISAAIDFESRAVEVYSSRAAETADPLEKEMYEWLADWERGHHKLLYQLNEELKESIWYDNNFWPF